MKTISILILIGLFIPSRMEAACEPNIPADLNGDCRVDFNDFAVMAADYLRSAVAHEWVAIYDGPANNTDAPQAIAMDGWGNVLVTGTSVNLSTYWDYTTVKYDTNGNELWAATYDGPANDVDQATSVGVDGLGNVVVTGRSDGNDTYADYATIKYDADGNEVWIARYDAAANDWDLATAMDVDNSGNVYVTGYSRGIGSGYDYATLKYDSDGNEVWVARYNGPGNDDDVPWAIATDNAGNVYVTGDSQGSFTDSDYATVKYDADGNEVWVARYNAFSGRDHGKAIVVDSVGNVFVTGGSQGIGYDYATIKYDSNGTQLWAARYNGPGNDADWASSIALDSFGNVYVTGRSDGLPHLTADYATIKYDPNGNMVWLDRYGLPDTWDEAIAIAVDSADHVYVAGTSSVYANGDFLTIKYDPNGNRLWVAPYTSGNGRGGPTAMVLDSAANVYVTGITNKGPGMSRAFGTLKYSPDYCCHPELTGDIDHDCVVDFADLAYLCDDWLAHQPRP